MPLMLTLIVPGLIWPHQALADLTCDLALPAFGALLGYGRLTHQAGQNSHAALAQQLGLDHPLPAAALRAVACGRKAGVSDWLALDPVQLRLEQTRVQLDDPQKLALSEAEAKQLAVSLGPTFRGLGELVCLAPLAWNLRLDPAATPPVQTVPLPQAIGRAISPLPSTPINRPWQAALNEAQMVLHEHPVNRAREAAGRPPVNSLWPWGGGHLAAPPAAACHPYRHLLADDPVARGAGHWLNLETRPLAESAPFTPAPATLVFHDALALSAQLGEATRWQEELLALEREWLAPLLSALRGGHLSALRLVLPGQPEGRLLNVRRRDLLRFWRRSAPLTVFALP